jgi:hypothetical protein
MREFAVPVCAAVLEGSEGESAQVAAICGRHCCDGGGAGEGHLRAGLLVVVGGFEGGLGFFGGEFFLVWRWVEGRSAVCGCAGALDGYGDGRFDLEMAPCVVAVLGLSLDSCAGSDELDFSLKVDGAFW